MVLAVPDVPTAARQAARRAAADARVAISRTRASCSTARPRCSTTTSRSGRRPTPRSSGSAARAAWPSGRGWSSWTSSWCRARRWSATCRSGIERGAELGGVMDIGYLPDMFGHVAQMPQLLRLAGMEHAVVWRGVPAAVEQTAFWWEAPDGSRVRAEYLYGSYSNGRDIPDDAKRLVLRALDYEHELGGARLRRHAADERHRPPDAAAVARARRRRSERDPGRLRVRRHVTARIPPRAARRGLDHRRGELRSGRARQPADGCRVEPGRRAPRVRGRRAGVGEAGRAAVARCSCGPEQYPHALARRRVAQSRAQQRARLVVRVQRRRSRRPGASSATQRHVRSATGSRATRCAALAAEVDAPAGATVVVNPTARRADGPRRRTRARPRSVPLRRSRRRRRARRSCSVRTAARGSTTIVTEQKVRWVLDLMRGTRVRGSPRSRAFEITRARQISSKCVCDEARSRRSTRRSRGAEGTRSSSSARPGTPCACCSRTRRCGGWCSTPASHRRLRLVRASPPADGPSPGDGGPRRPAEPRERAASRRDRRADGTYSIERRDGTVRLGGLGRLVDGGDGGDTYNYSPPEHDVVIDASGRVRVEVLETGPVRARVLDREPTTPCRRAPSVTNGRARRAATRRSPSWCGRRWSCGRPSEFLRVAARVRQPGA